MPIIDIGMLMIDIMSAALDILFILSFYDGRKRRSRTAIRNPKFRVLPLHYVLDMRA